MPTQEERLTAVEQAITTSRQFEDQAIRHLREIDASVTSLLGVIQAQGRDIRLIFERLDTMSEQLNEHGMLLREHSTMLHEILARLPEKASEEQWNENVR
jgi:hypothetical protein